MVPRLGLEHDMSNIFAVGSTAPVLSYPATHARLLHSGGWHDDGEWTATSTATGYSVDAIASMLTYEVWRPVSSPATITYDIPAADTDIDCIGIAAHTLGSTGCTVTVVVSNIDDSESAVVLLDHAPADDSPIMIYFGVPASTTAPRRIAITVSGWGADTPRIGVIRIGTALVMPQPIYAGVTPIGYARETVLRSNHSDTGEYLGRTVERRYLSTSYDWAHLTDAWVRDNWDAVQHAVESDLFFLAWRPGSNDDVGLCQVDEVPAPSYMGIQTYMTVGLTVRARGWV